MKPLFKEDEPKKAVKRKISFAWVKPLVIGFVFGAVVVALSLDNRGGAMLKAFMNPEEVNAVQFSSQIVVK